MDGTLAECDRVGDGRADYSSKHKRHGVNVQVVTDLVGKILWLSPALPGRTHDLTAARTHKIIRICERQGVPVLADMACIGASDWVTTAKRRPPKGLSRQSLAGARRQLRRLAALSECPDTSSIRAPLRLAMSWQTFRRARCSPNLMAVIAKAVLTLERQR